jgi:hypothetical protein
MDDRNAVNACVYHIQGVVVFWCERAAHVVDVAPNVDTGVVCTHTLLHNTHVPRYNVLVVQHSHYSFCARL